MQTKPTPPIDRAASLSTDPPADAWNWDPGLERAGLVVYELGAPLAHARRALVLFHGYGAQGDDLVGLSRYLQVPTDWALLFPAAPVGLPSGGRAWFRRDRSNFSMGVERARALLVALSREAPRAEMLVGGFSQGAMLAANLVERRNGSAAPRVGAAIMLSPADIFVQPPGSNGSARIPLFVAHGTEDDVLPFAGALSLRQQFEDAGYEVTWLPFEGRHELNLHVVAELNRFIRRLERGP